MRCKKTRQQVTLVATRNLDVRCTDERCQSYLHLKPADRATLKLFQDEISWATKRIDQADAWRARVSGAILHAHRDKSGLERLKSSVLDRASETSV